MLSMIAAMSHNRVIGKDNDLPWPKISEDFKRFKEKTLGKPIIMGYNTFTSLPNGPLPKRRNIVLSSQDLSGVEGIEVCHSVAAALHAVLNDPEAVVIGGQSVYEQLLPYVDRIYLTLIHNDYDGDRFFPLFEEHFIEVDRIPRGEFDFVTYNKK